MIVVDYRNMENNMYGCPPCPRCKGKYSAPYARDKSPTGIMVECDDCGRKEYGRSVNQDDLLAGEKRSNP